MANSLVAHVTNVAHVTQTIYYVRGVAISLLFQAKGSLNCGHIQKKDPDIVQYA